MSHLHEYICLCTIHVPGAQGCLKDGVGSLGTRVADGCDQPNG